VLSERKKADIRSITLQRVACVSRRQGRPRRGVAGWAPQARHALNAINRRGPDDFDAQFDADVISPPWLYGGLASWYERSMRLANFLNPYSYISLNGTGTMRGVTLELPSERVRELLPNGLELREQHVTKPGTHPVIVFFHDMFRAHMTIPSGLPNMTYHEHSLGVPYVDLAPSWFNPRRRGPFYFMPKLHLDNFFATLGGIIYWGYPKVMASVRVTDGEYVVTSSAGTTITSLRFRAVGDERPLSAFPHFEPIREMLNQPMISMLPIAQGPFFIAANFDKQWEVATMRPLETTMTVDECYSPGLEAGPYPSQGVSPGIDSTVLGSYELRAPWRLSLPYSPLFVY
jgi:hypothetical protein